MGRQVVATVLSTPKDGLVTVSMFGRRFLVETTLDLFKDQVLNLRVHATTPRVILAGRDEQRGEGGREDSRRAGRTARGKVR